MYGRLLIELVEQFIGNIRSYAEFLVGEEFPAILDKDVMRFIMVPSTQKKYLAFNSA